MKDGKKKIMKMVGKKANRGVFAKEEGDYTDKKKTAVVSYTEGTKQNPKLPDKSLTPKAKMMKKKVGG